MSTKTTHLRISTPNGIFFDEEVDILTVKTPMGYIGIQRNRLPFISNIEISVMYINSKSSNNEKICAIDGGLIYVEREYVDIFTDEIMYKEDIDELKVQKLIDKTRKSLENKTSTLETLKNEILLEKAINRMSTINLK